MSNQEDFICIICHEVVRGCETAECCNALFCGACVGDFLLNSSANTIRCPKCRNEKFTTTKNVALQRIADNIDIECEPCGRAYKHSASHRSWCPFGTTNCHYQFLGCKWMGERKRLEAHLEVQHSPRCLNGHRMRKETANLQIFQDCVCDVCGHPAVGGYPFYTCGQSSCDYAECPGCFVHRPIFNLQGCFGDRNVVAANSTPSRVVVTGAGNPAVNGIYIYDGFSDGGHHFKMEGTWNGERKTFTIFSCCTSNNVRYWYISIAPRGLNLGTNSDIDFYSAPFENDSKTPPTTGWAKCNEGEDPLPRLHVIYDNDGPNNTS